MFSNNKKVKKLLEYAKEIKSLDGIASLISWDQNTGMPQSAANARAYQRGLLASISHKKLTDKKFGKLIQELATDIENNGTKYTLYDKALARESKRIYDEATKLPEKFVKKHEETTSQSFEAWKQAKTKKDFKIFESKLKTVIDLKKEEIDYLGYDISPYDALLEQYEPGLTEQKVNEVFEPLKRFTIDFLNKVQNSKVSIDTSILKRKYDIYKQYEFSKKIASTIGFNFESGRLDQSPHPFTTYIGTSSDVRITTRIIEDYIPYSILAVIHECGHGMYEQNIDKTFDMTYLSRGISYGIHKSQSRMWENMIGRSAEFWEFWYPKLCDNFSNVLKPSEKEKFVLALNKVAPDLIRVDANEVTYNLHIIIRFELETALINGDIKVVDLPNAWDEMVYKYLGTKPQNQAEGVLQDIHWSKGSFGYFPTYTLGNLYAAQFWNKALADKPNILNEMKSGQYKTISNWLKENIQKYGKAYTADEVCIKVTGETLNSKYLIDYIKQRFSKIYTDIQ